MTATSFTSRCIAQSTVNQARVMQFTTAHGAVLTPAFMPVGTRAFVNHLTPQDLIDTGSQIILGGNTYHMLVNPGMATLQAAGGMHRLMGWQRPMLTDSGGFQVFSLSEKICKIDEQGARFKHPINGKMTHLTPQTSIAAQKIIGADIIMAFDQCTPEQGGRAAALTALARTDRWLAESCEAHAKNTCAVYGHSQALFGIVQGGSFLDLRVKSAETVVAANVDGIAIGGEVIGFNMPTTLTIIDSVRDLLPAHKIRYTMGVGLHPQDLIDTVAHGIDIFDCVAPTRNARHGALYHGELVIDGGWVTFIDTLPKGRLLIKKAMYATDDKPILENCTCTTCQQFSRAYLHFLFKQRSSLYHQLACIHNIHLLQQVCETMRMLILNNSI